MNVNEVMKYLKVFSGSNKPSLSVEEFAKQVGIDIEKSKKILRKLWKEGFIKKTRSKRYKLSLAAILLLKLLKEKTSSQQQHSCK